MRAISAPMHKRQGRARVPETCAKQKQLAFPAPEPRGCLRRVQTRWPWGLFGPLTLRAVESTYTQALTTRVLISYGTYRAGYLRSIDQEHMPVVCLVRRLPRYRPAPPIPQPSRGMIAGLHSLPSCTRNANALSYQTTETVRIGGGHSKLAE